ncbi:hypothetical protein MMC31_000577 [Peltigera leucophlebia]|nr:hypothetical protein [Peltigera leucophlebia]
MARSRESTVDPLDLDFDAVIQVEDDTSIERDREYTVEAILGHRIIQNGKILYHVKWEGLEKESDRTWETEENFLGAQAILDIYWGNPKSLGGEKQAPAQAQIPPPMTKLSKPSNRKRALHPSPKAVIPPTHKKSRQLSPIPSRPTRKKGEPPPSKPSAEPIPKKRPSRATKKEPLTLRRAYHRKIRGRPGAWDGDHRPPTSATTHLPIIDAPANYHSAGESDTPPGTVSVGFDNWRPPSPIDGAWENLVRIEEIKLDEQEIMWAFLRWQVKDRKGRFYRSGAKVDTCRQACPQRFTGDSEPYSPPRHTNSGGSDNESS